MTLHLHPTLPNTLHCRRCDGVEHVGGLFDVRPAPWRVRLEAKRDHPDPNVRRWELGIDQQILQCRFIPNLGRPRTPGSVT